MNNHPKKPDTLIAPRKTLFARLDKKDLLIGIAIFTLALLVRFFYLYESSANPSFGSPIVDSETYNNAAKSLASGKGMSSQFFWQPFFYPLFLTTVYLAGNSSIISAKLIQLLLGCVTCLLTYHLASKIFDRRTGIIAAIITALYGPLVFFEAELLASGWTAFWSVVLILLLLKTSSKKSISLCFILGICGALSIITRPTFVPFFAAAAVWLAIIFYRDHDSWPKFALKLAAICTGFLLITIPVAAQNLRITGHFGILPSSGGINFYIGNNPNYTQTLTARPGWGWEEIVSLPEQNGVTGDLWEKQKFYKQKVINYLFTQPLALAIQESRIEVAGIEFKFVNIPPGTFNMGSNSGDGDERPVHTVTIDYSFEIGKTEVTVRQFKVFVEATGYKTDAEKQGRAWHCPCPDQLGYARNRNWQNPGFDQTENHPVVCISHNDAKAFCKWLSQQTRQHFRLPTEAEWEYACRAGTTGNYAGDIKQMAWFDMTSSGRTSPVAAKKPNPWGIYDMHGNVWEWCEDIYHWHYKNAPADGSANTNPDVPAAIASRRVLRGGAWCRPKTTCTSSFRCPAHSAFRECGTGFRIVRSGKPPAAKADLTVCSAKKSRKPSARDGTGPAELTLTVGDIEFGFVRIDPGTFVMGSPFRYVDRYNWTYELPAHEVTVGYSYYMGKTEVTLEQFDLFVEDTGYVTDAEKQGWAFTCIPDTGWYYEILRDWRFPGYMQTDTEPVTHITWYDAIAFCRWLSEKTGRDIRLPSEAEWEYACRAGTTGDYAGDLHEMGWHLWNSDFRTHPVAQKKPNSWGLYDMHGNVWEWVLDLWHPDANGAPTDGSAWLESPHREPPGLTRGGSFGNPPWLCRSYIRMRMLLGCRAHYNNGFRLVMSLH